MSEVLRNEIEFQTSIFSGTGDCVAVGQAPDGTTLMRDSLMPTGTTLVLRSPYDIGGVMFEDGVAILDGVTPTGEAGRLVFTPGEWHAYLMALGTGQFGPMPEAESPYDGDHDVLAEEVAIAGIVGLGAHPDLPRPVAA